MMRAVIIASASLLLAACAVSPLPDEGDAGSADAARQILLTVHQPARVGRQRATGGNYARRGTYRSTPAVERTLDELARTHGLRRVTGWPIRSLDAYCEVLAVPDGLPLETVIDQIAADPRVDLVQRMNIFETLVSRYDDPYAEMQTAVQELGVEQAHNLATGRGVTVAVVDSSVDADHADLGGRVRIKRDLVESPREPRRGEVHGTAVAGIIASAVDNGEGIVGVAPDVDIAALRACWPAVDGASHCSSFTLAKALEAAVTIEPEIINLSLAGPFDPLLSRLLDGLIERGTVVVAAHPESGAEDRVFPASHPRVIVASMEAAQPAGAPRYTLTAPGTEVLTTVPDSGYAFLSGSSLAAAHVSGVIALLLEEDPDIGIDDVAALLARTSVDNGAGAFIHACHALEALIDRLVCDADVLSF